MRPRFDIRLFGNPPDDDDTALRCEVQRLPLADGERHYVLLVDDVPRDHVVASTKREAVRKLIDGGFGNTRLQSARLVDITSLQIKEPK